MNQEPLLSTKQVAERLNVTQKTIQRWIKAGEFPNARRKRPVPLSPFQIPESDVIAFEQRRDRME